MEGMLGAAAGFAAHAGPALLMIAAFLLALAGRRMLMRGENRQKAVLMLVCAVVFVINVAIWTV